MAIYFLDSENGNDLNNGLDALKAFKSLEKINATKLLPGDKVLLKKGCVFTGHLHIKDSGEKYNPIIVSSYGHTTNKPVISTEDGFEYSVCVSGQYTTIKGLEVTNPKGKKGISVNSTLHGAVDGIVISDCFIHDVWTINSQEANDIDVFLGHCYRGRGSGDHSAGGISVETNKEAPTWYDNLRIENNFIFMVNRTGIWFGGQWFNRFKNSFPWVTNKADGMDDPWYPHHNIYIGHNLVDHSYGDGIIGIGCKNLLIEHNRVFYANCMSREGGCNVGLWSMCCDGAVIQYNEVAYTGCEFGGDGEGFDIDNCSRDTIVQYNYSHDNAAGFILVCNITCNSKESHCNHIIRNNLSINDASKEDTAIFNFTGSSKDTYILNNTVYTENENLYRMFQVDDYAEKGFAQDVYVSNNLFVSKHINNYNNFKGNGTFTFDSNVMINMPQLPEKENIIEKNTHNINPVLQGSYHTPGSRLETKAYIPRWNSPLLRLGKHFDQCADKDYNGIDTRGHNYVGAFYYKDANIG